MAVTSAQIAQRRFVYLKAALFCIALLPLVRLVLAGFSDRLGANPIEFITRNTGAWALYFLCITLAITPVRHLTQWHRLAGLRRMFGLFTFFYASLHFLTFLWFDHFFDFQEMLKDVVKRPFITVGFAAFVCLIPLAATSTNAIIKRMGAKRWQWLHRLIYLIAPLTIVHYWWMKSGKNDYEQPLIFGALVLLLLGLRVGRAFSQRRQKRQVNPAPT